MFFSGENHDRTRNSFLGLPDVDMDKSESEIDKVVEELEGLAGLKAFCTSCVFFKRKNFPANRCAR